MGLNREMATDVQDRKGCAPVRVLADIESGIGEDKLTPGFVKQLENFYKGSGTGDRSNCLDLVSTLKLRNQIETTYHYRPNTAMPSLGGHPSSDILNPYNTTYKSEFYPRKHPQVKAHRPMTSQGFTNTYHLSDPIETTHYTEEFNKKPPCRSLPIRSGSSSGNRANKPHPPETFMVWRFPSNAKAPDASQVSEKLINEKINEIHKRMCSSTYKNDYLGIPQGFQVQSAFDGPSDYRDCAPYSLETSQRYSYQGARQDPNLRAPNTRYGANTKKHIYSVGLIPTANEAFNRVKNNTTYDKHYNEKAAALISRIREDGQKRDMEALRNYEKAVQARLEGQACANSHWKNHDDILDEDRQFYDKYYDNRRSCAPRTPKPPSRARPVVPESTVYTDFASRAPPNCSHHITCTDNLPRAALTVPDCTSQVGFVKELSAISSPPIPHNTPLFLA